jgi:cold-inducible RNA-binding protein
VSVRLFIGNLPYTATDADLRTLFSEVAPPLQVVVPVDRETGRPRGFAFVDFAEREHAEQVVEKFNGQPLQGRPLAVSEARAREDRPAGPRPGGYSSPRPGGYSGGPPGGMGGGMGGSRPPGAGPRPFAPRDPGGALPTPESRRQRAKPGARKQTYEKGPRGPIKQRPVTRLYDEDEEEPVDLSEFDDPASRTPDGDEAETDLDMDDLEADDVETEEDE